MSSYGPSIFRSRVRNILLSLPSLHSSTVSLLPPRRRLLRLRSSAFPRASGPALLCVFIRRSEGRLLERIKPIHTLNLSTASHPATWCTSRIKRCYVNMEKVVDSCMRRTWISLSCPTSRETDAFVSLASLSILSRVLCHGTRALRSRISVPHTGYPCRTNREFPFVERYERSPPPLTNRRNC